MFDHGYSCACHQGNQAKRGGILMSMTRRDYAGIIFLSIVAMFLIFGGLLMRPFGAPEETAMDQYIIDNTQEETGANNGVTAVVFDYRGFDTLGEATVLFTAVAGVIMIFRRLNK
jgi:multisubunit Na+/H+ antiporter MnhB subunit